MSPRVLVFIVVCAILIYAARWRWLLIGWTSYNLPPNLGNMLTAEVCLSHLKHVHCWDPHYWENPTLYEEFWEAYGHEVRTSKYGLKSQQSGTILHIRCGDYILNDPKYPCDSAIKNILWNHPNITIIAGGHRSNLLADRACGVLIKHYAYLARNSVLVKEPANVEDDFALLSGASTVITIRPSSFVFSAKAYDLSNLYMFTDENPIASWWVKAPHVRLDSWWNLTKLHC